MKSAGNQSVTVCYILLLTRSVMTFAGDSIQPVSMWLLERVVFFTGVYVIDDMGCVEIIEYNEESKEFAFVNRLPISMGECNTIDIDRRHNLLAVGSSDSILTIIDYCEMIPVSSFKIHKLNRSCCMTPSTGIKRARWTSRGDYVAFCSSDSVITLVSPLTGEIKKNYQISEYSTVRAGGMGEE